MEQLERHRAAGATFISLNLGDADVPFVTQIRMAGHFTRWIADHADRYVLAERAGDVRAAKAQGRVAIAFDVEGARAIGNDIRLIELLHAVGVRWMALVFNRRNLVGGGVHDTEDGGLTPFGHRVLAELEHVGITVCCSHTGYRTANDVLDAATKPVIFSHSNALAVHPHPRNVPDDLIRRCAASGGVVGVNGLSIFLGSRTAMLDAFVAHAEHVAGLVGPAHVGVGLDYVFDQEDMDRQLAAARGTWPSGYGYEPGIRYLPPEALPEVTDVLLRRGWSDADVLGLLGGNFLRVADATWR